jgi:hypothetical protein
VTDKKIGAYRQAVEKVEPSLASLLEETAKIPGAAVMYPTFESISPVTSRPRARNGKARRPGFVETVQPIALPNLAAL